jgi:hypothetical protein
MSRMAKQLEARRPRERERGAGEVSNTAVLATVTLAGEGRCGGVTQTTDTQGSVGNVIKEQ